MLQLAIVHEIVRHHLDKQYHWWDQLTKCLDEDELWTWQALVEGRASAGNRGRRRPARHAPPMFGLLAQRYRTVPEMGADPDRLSVIQAIIFRQKLDARTHGKDFFARLVRDGVKPAEATAFTTPPRQLLWISRPELYVKALRGGLPDLRKVLTGLERLPPGSKATAAQQPLGPEMVRQVAGMLQEQPRAEAVLKGWEEGRTLAWFAPSAAGSIAISIARFDTPASARAYHGLSLDLQRKRDEMMNSNCTSTCKVTESKCEAVDMPRAELAVRCFKKVKYSNGQTAAADMLYVLAGSLVIEVNGVSVTVDPAWARQVVANIVSEFAAAQQGFGAEAVGWRDKSDGRGNRVPGSAANRTATPVVNVAMTGPQVDCLGRTANYTLSVTNVGNVPVANAQHAGHPPGRLQVCLRQRRRPPRLRDANGELDRWRPRGPGRGKAGSACVRSDEPGRLAPQACLRGGRHPRRTRLLDAPVEGLSGSLWRSWTPRIPLR